MTESNTILQLGIEAAREGNREEARNLFSLLTRQEPDNVQGWLWYAGVAEGQDERRAALERVVELDPNNEMARRGLQAMGVSPGARAASTPPVAPTVPAASVADTPPVRETPSVAPAVEPARDLTEDEQLAAELDAAYDDYDTVERSGPAFRNDPTPLRDDDDLDAAAVGTSAADRVRARRGSRSYDDQNAYDDEAQPARRPLGLLLLLAALILLAILAFLFVPRLLNRGGNTVAGTGTTFAETSVPNSGGVAGNTNNVSGTTGLSGTGTISGTNTVTSTAPITGTNGVTGSATLTSTVPMTSTAPLTGTAPITPTAVTGAPAAPTAETGAPAAPTTVPAAPGDLASANPQVVPTGQNVDANGWSYTFPGFCSGSCAVVLGKQVGNNTAQGNYVMTLLLVSNNTGSEQAIPQNFFVIKDGQGKVYTPLPQVSSAYVVRGVNADRSQEDTIPAGTGGTSVPLVFDIPSGATNLVLFSSANTGQGFQVLNAVP